MTDIIIYTTPEKLLHKQGKLEDDKDHSPTGDYYWSFRFLPRWLAEEESKIYFATKGFIRGYFILEEIQDDSIIFNCETWTDLETPVPIKHFQGLKYKK